MTTTVDQAPERWAIVSLFGHTERVGRISDIADGAMVRVDIPLEDGSFSTRDIGRGAIYEVTYVTEEVARAVAKARPAHPVQSWSVRSLGLLDAHVVDCDPDDLADPGEDAGDESDDVAGPL